MDFASGCGAVPVLVFVCVSGQVSDIECVVVFVSLQKIFQVDFVIVCVGQICKDFVEAISVHSVVDACKSMAVTRSSLSESFVLFVMVRKTSSFAFEPVNHLH